MKLTNNNLRSEVRRLRRKLRDVTAEMWLARKHGDDYFMECQRLNAEIRKLRGQLAKFKGVLHL